MLKLKDITKVYVTKTMRQVAVNHISLSFRRREFVAILGPSGSGKTTLLNIIGGLDHYDSGDLLISGRSTKEYKQRDWDNYRNHSVGFVFQSYNLIMHQSVLKNVELALTIAGIPEAERKQKAIDALNKVGLGDHIYKHPQELSGGQMQRVAIARAIVNQPEIILADEPTGALDSKTSVQIMDILKDMAKDHLVIMVTHNPELAKEYASRVITIKDGQIHEDTNPFDDADEEAQPLAGKKASMSFLTALSLSFSNLITKKARTALVSFAGSIGIIGIALVLALSDGVNNYINAQEMSIVSAYPLTVSQTGIDLTSMMSNNMTLATGTGKKSKGNKIGVQNTVSNLLTQVSNNDLKSFKTYLTTHNSTIMKYAQAVQYDYDITPQIYRETKKGYSQVNPNSLMEDFTSNNRMSAMMGSSLSANVFNELPSAKKLYVRKYQLKGGHYPKNSHELLLVLDNQGKVSDLVLYALGMKDSDDLKKMLKDFSSGKNVKTSQDKTTYQAKDFIGKTFKLIYNDKLYSYNKKTKLWINNAKSEKKVKKLLKSAQTLKISGVVQIKDSKSVESLSTGISYPQSLTKEIMNHAKKSPVVKAQLAHKKTNILTNKKFGAQNDLNLKDLITIDQSQLKKMTSSANSFKMPSLDMQSVLKNINLNDLNTNSVSLKSLGLTQKDLNKLASSIKINATNKNINDLMTKLTKAFAKDKNAQKSLNSLQSYLSSKEALSILSSNQSSSLSSADLNTYLNTVLSNYPAYVTAHQLDPSNFSENLTRYLSDTTTQKTITSANSSLLKKSQTSTKVSRQTLKKLSDGYSAYVKKNNTDSLNDAFVKFMQSSAAQKTIREAAEKMIDTKGLQKTLSQMIAKTTAQMTKQMQSQIQKMSSQLAKSISASISSSMAQATKQMSLFSSMDPTSLGKLIKVNMSGSQLSSLMESLTSSSSTSYESNLSAMGYCDPDTPTSIRIYPRNFTSKNKITAMITKYNNDKEKKGQLSKKITYTDMIGVLMSSITRMINTISLVLIAFVAISLIVSSIMIGVITYISVLERRKEIGVLRAIGASAFNIAEVFNAETFISGMISGVMGIGIAALLTIPANAVIAKLLSGAEVKVSVSIESAIGLILLSVVLNVIAGILPSLKAAKSDPVEALRSE